MYAVVDIGGKQWKVEKADTIRVPSLDAKPDKSLSFDRVLLVVDKGTVHIGNPIVSNARVLCTVLNHGKADKIKVFKKKRRKDYQVLKGHRQGYTEIRIDKIELGKASKAQKPSAKAAPSPEAAEGKPDVEKTKKAPSKTVKKPSDAEQKPTSAAGKKAAAGKATAGKAAAGKKAAAKKSVPKASPESGKGSAASKAGGSAKAKPSASSEKTAASRKTTSEGTKKSKTSGTKKED